MEFVLPVARFFLSISVVVLPQSLIAQEPEHDASDLAKQTQNPVADLVSVPFQFNFNSGGGLEDQTFFLMNFQPVVPMSISANWKLIARTIVPIASLPSPAGTRYSGVGDIQEQLYFTPAKAGAIIWGVGPVLSLPTSTNDLLRTGSWAAGPGAVVVKMTGPFVLGGLVNQYWPFHDDGGHPETDLFVLQPFINYNFGKGWAIAFAPLITANWNAEEGQQWTVPLGLGITRTTVFNRRPMSLGVQYYYNVERPDNAASSQLRFIVSLLFPSARGK